MNFVMLYCYCNNFLIKYSLSAYVYDAVLLWAYGVNLTLEQRYAPDNGIQITKNIFNLTFDGMTGTVLIDNEGDRHVDQR